MNILFLSLLRVNSLEERGIYTDLLRVFVKNGHFVRIVSPVAGEPSRDIRGDGYAILQVETPQIQKANLIRKGLATLQIGPRVKAALQKHCAGERYDLILMATPPVTLAGVVQYVKTRDNAKVYLLLKDIWPQGIADLGAISPKGPVYRYFRAKEKKLYALSDRIGCMSQANVDYLLRHDPEIDPARVEVCPNSIEPVYTTVSPECRAALREKYHVPQNKTVFIYGGNLGRPQGIPFLIRCLEANADKDDRFFVICGTGTEFPKLKAFMEERKPSNILLMNGLPREEFEHFVAACDVGMIFLDYRFTIPNFPSRLLSYMQAGLPVLCCTDPNTDIGDVIEQGNFGWKCLSDEPDGFTRAVEQALLTDLPAMGANGRVYLKNNYTTKHSYEIIMHA